MSSLKIPILLGIAAALAVGTSAVAAPEPAAHQSGAAPSDLAGSPALSGLAGAKTIAVHEDVLMAGRDGSMHPFFSNSVWI